jgi:ABC-type uncharacterized transport system
MATTQEHKETWLETLNQKPRQTAYVLLAIAVLFGIATVAIAAKYRWEYGVIAAGFGWLAVVFLWAGVFQLRREPGRAGQLDASRALVLAVAGLSGLIVTLMGLVLAWQWWDTYLAWLRSEPGNEGWRMWLSLIAFFGGLAIMFAGLQLTRTEERSNPFFRRMLYGYNAVLTTMLLMAILVVVNVLVYVNFATAIDFTASNLYSLSSRSKNILQGLDQPTKIYVLIPVGNVLQQEMQTLLSNCREANDKIEVKYLSPDLDEDQVRELEKKYSFTGREGALVIYGTPPEENHRFIPMDDLYSFDNMGSRELKFKGEDAIMTALSALSEGKSKPVVYFTQGHGELDLNNSDPSRLDEGAGALKSRLEKRNYDVKPLELGAASPKVPDDASIVVIARPSIPFTPAAIDALRRYMKPADPTKKKGKLFVLFDVVVTAENTMVRTGLEAFLKEFNVEVGNERVLSFPSVSDNPAQVIVMFNPDLPPENPLLATFGRQLIPLYNVRPVKPMSSPPGGPPGSELRAESLLIAPFSLGIWAEPDLQADPIRILNDLQKNPRDLKAKLSEQSIPVAVAVSESAASADPHAFMRPQAGQTPRLVVFGDATLACNRFTTDRRGNSLPYDVIANTMDWLREKPSNIGIEPKSRNMFTIDTANTNLYRMIFLPAALMLLGILGLGTGVWIVRRQ